MSEEKEKPVVHIYNGIEEHDNPIPAWFTAFFLGTIFFALVYYNYYELWGGPSLRQEYERAMNAHATLRMEHESKAPKASESELLALVKSPESEKQGRAIYVAKCASCHGNEGQGGIGPNLTDAYWIHGGKITEVRDTILNGVLDKGMPPWGGVLEAKEVNALAGFIRSRRGTNPAGAKQAQGVLVKGE